MTRNATYLNIYLFQVFIAGGELHIVPYPRTPGELPILPIGVPMVQQSVTAIQKYPQLTTASEKIREAINSRIARSGWL